MCSPCKECENVSPSCSERLNFLEDTSSAAAEAARYLWSLCLVILMNSSSPEVRVKTWMYSWEGCYVLNRIFELHIKILSDGFFNMKCRWTVRTLVYIQSMDSAAHNSLEERCWDMEHDFFSPEMQSDLQGAGSGIFLSSNIILLSKNYFKPSSLFLS